MNNKKSLVLNLEYAVGFGAYWMIYAVVGSFASVFMLEKGYDNTEIGLTLALANVLALIVQPGIADYTDISGRSGIIKMSISMAAAIILLTIGMYVFGGGTLALAMVFVFIIALHTVMQPLLNSLPFKLKGIDAELEFGLGRAGGSLGFSLILAVLGTLVERSGVMVIPAACIAVCTLFILMMAAIQLNIRKKEREAGAVLSENGLHDAEDAASDAMKDDERIGLREFAGRNRMFFVMNLGAAGLFFSNAVLTNYMAQISASVGGTTEDLGRILSLMAFLEIPPMLLFGLIRKRFSSRTLIKVGAMGFAVKIILCALAQSVSMLYAMQFVQLFAFALFMPAMVYFTGEIMSGGEGVKGQALFTMMITLSSIAASLIGGWMLDAYGARVLTITAAVVTGAGALIVILSADRVGKRLV